MLAEADGNPLALLELPAALSGSSKVPVALAFPKLGVTNRTALARLDLAGPDDLP